MGAPPWKSRDTYFQLIPGVALPYFLKMLQKLSGFYPGGAPHRILILHRFFIDFGRLDGALQKPCFFLRFLTTFLQPPPKKTSDFDFCGGDGMGVATNFMKQVKS